MGAELARVQERLLLSWPRAPELPLLWLLPQHQYQVHARLEAPERCPLGFVRLVRVLHQLRVPRPHRVLARLVQRLAAHGPEPLPHAQGAADAGQDRLVQHA